MEVAVRAAREAGAIIRRDFGRPSGVAFKARMNPVTETDLAAERAVVSVLAREFPSHDILTEESAQAPRRSEYLWVIDPMDGTVNFTHNYPCVCSSVGLMRGNEIIAGAVFDPIHDELFAAGKGDGATLNGSPLRVSSVPSLEGSLLCTGFPYRLMENPGDTFRVFERISLLVQGVRRDGSAALDICYVAAGRFEGFWERELRPWDTAAGVLILREAGGRATGFSGKEFDPFMPEIACTNSLVHEEMLGVFRTS
jgi:myo-inositol-1(or 4)-monophosphatase